MTKRMTDDERMEARDRARHRADDRAFDRLSRRMDEAETLIGELCREGRTVFYVNLRNRDGALTGRTREDSRTELVRYLLANRYA